MNQVELASHPLFADANLVAYWKLENTSDSKGSRTLTNFGSTPFNSALFNNGADVGNVASTTKYLYRADNCGIGSGNFTMNIWYKYNGTLLAGNFPHIFTIGDATSHLYHQIGFNSGNTVRFRSAGFNTGTGILKDYTHSVSQVSFDMLTMTFDGTTLRGYINGVEVTSGTGSRSGSGGTNNTVFMVYLGDAGINSADGRRGGIVDDASVFSRALSTDEVYSLYDLVIPGGSSFLLNFLNSLPFFIPATLSLLDKFKIAMQHVKTDYEKVKLMNEFESSQKPLFI